MSGNSFENNKSPEQQHTDGQIREVITEHPEVFPEIGRADDNEIDQTKKEFEIISQKIAKLEFDGNPGEKVKNLKKEFREFYEKMHKSEDGMQKSETVIKEMREKFENLASSMILERTIMQLRIWGVEMTDKEVQIELKSAMRFGEFNFRIDEDGKLERTCYFDWIGKKLPKVEKFLKNENEIENTKNKKKYVRKSLELVIQLTNAHFFGVENSREEIERLAKSKKQAIEKEQTRQRENPSQNLPNSQNPNELYSPKN